MTDKKLEKFRTQVSDQAGVENKAKRLAEIDTQLEPHQENLFVRLEFNEHSRAEQIGFGVTGAGDKYSGLRLYIARTHVFTGVFRDIGYQQDKVIFNSVDLYEWDPLYLFDGPKIERVMRGLPLDVQIINAKNEKDGILVWNGNLPVVYREGFGMKSAFSSGGRYAPGSLPKEGLDSVAVVIGNNAVARLFGLEKADGITDARTLYQAVLVQEGMDPRILEGWGPDKIKVGVHSQRVNIFRPLEERIRKMPTEFFEEGIFIRYGIEKPEGYNMTSGQRIAELTKLNGQADRKVK